MPVHQKRAEMLQEHADFHSHWKQSCPNYIQPPFALRRPRPRSLRFHGSPGDLTSKAGIQTRRDCLCLKGAPPREHRQGLPPPRGVQHELATQLGWSPANSQVGGTAPSQFQRTGARVSSLRAPRGPSEAIISQAGLQLAPQITLRGQSDQKGVPDIQKTYGQTQNLGHAVAVKNYWDRCQHRLRSIRNGDTQYPFSTSGGETRRLRPWDLSYSG